MRRPAGNPGSVATIGIGVLCWRSRGISGEALDILRESLSLFVAAFARARVAAMAG